MSYGGQERCRVFLEKPDGKKLLEDVGIDGSIILKIISQARKGGGMDWNGLGQDRDRWWALVNEVMNFWVP